MVRRRLDPRPEVFRGAAAGRESHRYVDGRLCLRGLRQLPAGLAFAPFVLRPCGSGGDVGGCARADSGDSVDGDVRERKEAARGSNVLYVSE